MRKIFLATSFSGKTDEQGRVLPQYREFIENILIALRAEYEVFCAAEFEGWQYYHATAEAGVKMDLAEIDKADALLAILHTNISAGLHIEIGYAVAKGKKVILVTDEGMTLNYFNQGLVKLGKASYFEYENPAALSAAVKNNL